MGGESSDAPGYFDRPRSPQNSQTAGSPGPLATDGRTMIFPIRSLLSEVQRSSTPGSPEHREGLSWMHPASGDITNDFAWRNPSIQQRRTAQWQANISSRVSTGDISTPNSPQSRRRSLTGSVIDQPELRQQGSFVSPDRDMQRNLGCKYVSLCSSNSNLLFQLHIESTPSQNDSVSSLSVAPSPAPESESEVDLIDHRLTTRNLTRMTDSDAGKSNSERTGSFAAGGYVHLGPTPMNGTGAGSLKSDPKSEKFTGPEMVSLPPSDSSSSLFTSISSSESMYPKTSRFEHIETEQGGRFLPILFLIP